MPTISVIVPVYNVEKYLARCLDSILNQTFADFELICINDGSNDGSLAILQEYAQKDARIIVLDQENQGQSVARNRGLDIAQGEYIVFVDSDDAIEQQALEIAYHCLEGHDADVLQWEASLDDGIDAPCSLFPTNTIQIQDFSLYDNFRRLQKLNKHTVWSYVFKKNILEDIYFMPHIYHEDALFLSQVWLKHPHILKIQEHIYLYTINRNSVMGQIPTIKHMKSLHIVLNEMYSLYSKQTSQDFPRFMQGICIPKRLSMQLRTIAKTPFALQLPLWVAFEELIRDLQKQKILPQFSRRYKKESTIYDYLLTYGAQKYYEHEVLSWQRKAFFIKRRQYSVTYYIFGRKIFSRQRLSVKKRAIQIFGLTFTYTKK